MKDNFEFKSPLKLSMWIKRLMYAHIIVSVLLILSISWEIKILWDFKNGTFSNQTDFITVLASAEEITINLSFLFISLFLGGGILIFKWIHRCNKNVRALGSKQMKFSPGWSVGWFFVPIANLFKPFHVMNEIWSASHSPNDWSANEKPKAILKWWILWIASNSVPQISSNLEEKAQTIDEFMKISFLNLGGEVLWIILCFAFISIVTKISQAQIGQKEPTD